jgi:hypothetical protein
VGEIGYHKFHREVSSHFKAFSKYSPQMTEGNLKYISWLVASFTRLKPKFDLTAVFVEFVM